MADIRISQLPAVTTPGSNDPFHLIAGATDSRITFANLKNAVRPADGTTTASGLLRLATNADVSGSVATAAVGADLLKALNDRVAALEAGGGGGGGGTGAAPSGVVSGSSPFDSSYVLTTLASGEKYLTQWGYVTYGGLPSQTITYPTTFKAGSYPCVTLTVFDQSDRDFAVLLQTRANNLDFAVYTVTGALSSGSFVAWQSLGPAP